MTFGLFLSLLLFAPHTHAGGAQAAHEAPFATIDDLYLHRHIRGNLNRSVEMLEDVLKREPENPEALWRLGRNIVRLGELEPKVEAKIMMFSRAEGMIAKSISLAPGNPEAHFWYGLSLGRNGEARGILKSLFMIGPLKKRMRRVLELDPNHGGAHHVLGRMYFKLPVLAGGSNRKAVEELEKALELSPNYTANYGALAEAYIAVGAEDKAVAVLKRFGGVQEPSDPAVYEEHRKDVSKLLSQFPAAGRTR